MTILEENSKWHLEAFASELFIYTSVNPYIYARISESIYTVYVFVCVNELISLKIISKMLVASLFSFEAKIAWRS